MVRDEGSGLTRDGALAHLPSMPLSRGTSDKARQRNIDRELKTGRNPAQAVAIGYNAQLRNEQDAARRKHREKRAAK